jgi:hypothetical protein
LALIVGINAYGSPVRSLQGCVTDAQLMQELLVHRFGFSAQDVLLVTDKTALKPTRAGILQAFEEHLIQQAKPGDVVVFHFSGHGSQVSDQPDCDSVAQGLPVCVNSTFCPSDSIPAGGSLQGGVVNDIMGHTLFLLMSAVQTENLTVVLDSCHAGGGTRGNFLVRAIPRMGGGQQFQPSPQEKDLQKSLLSQLKLSPKEFLQQRRLGVAKGVVIAAAKREQSAADVPIDDFHAGAFTYTMSRYLWQQTSADAISNALPKIALSAKTQAVLANITQDPLAEYKPGSQNEQKPFFFLTPNSLPAEAVITAVNGNQFTCWLGGVDTNTLAAFGQDTIFAVIDSQGQEQAEVKLTARQGLEASGALINSAQSGALRVGALLQEKVRGIPSDIALEIAIDASLGNDKAAAEQALTQVPRLKVVPQGQASQYLLVRGTEANRQQWAKVAGTTVPPVGSVGLASPGLDDILSDSFGPAGESLEAAISRLQPKFKLLLAGRLLQLMQNSNSSRLSVDVQVLPVGQKSVQPIANAGTSRGRQPASLPSGSRSKEIFSKSATQKLKSGSGIEVKVQNGDNSPLYIAVLGIASDGNMAVLFPSADWNAPGDAALVNAKETITIPRAGKDEFEIQINGTGVAQVLVLASSSSLRNALKGLQKVASQQGIRKGMLPLEDGAVNAVEDLLGGLDQNTRSTSFSTPPTGKRAISTAQFAAISVAVEVVE